MKRFAFIFTAIFLFTGAFVSPSLTKANNGDVQIKPEHINIEMRPPLRLGKITNNAIPAGYSPSQIRAAYNLSATSSSQTIAIVDAYDNPNAEKDLGMFSTQYNLPSCTTLNGCFTKHKMSSLQANTGWALEESLDVQWVHALAPQAHILLIEAKSSRLGDLLSAVSYAKSQLGVTAVSMSWGASEFSGSNAYDSYFSQTGVTFYASSGDNGAGVEWPAVSVNVVGVGGTSLTLNGTNFVSESAWSGSGGGISSFVTEPTYQSAFGISSNGKRAVPDVSFDADPNTGVSVYDSYGYNGQKGWFVVGGTSVGAPSWAAMKALSLTDSNETFYTDAVTNYANFFRDVTIGTNGSCGVVCTANAGYDFVTGLGSPHTSSF